MDLIMAVCDRDRRVELRPEDRQGRPGQVHRDEAGAGSIPGKGVTVALLEVRGLRVRYGEHRGGARPLFLRGGRRIVALIGANGAGKSSTLLALSGLVRAGRGKHPFPRAGTSPRRRADRIVGAGLVQVPEGTGHPGPAERGGEPRRWAPGPARSPRGAGRPGQGVRAVPRLADRARQLPAA